MVVVVMDDAPSSSSYPFIQHVFTINGSTYVIVSGNAADNIGIINITNPLSPVHRNSYKVDL